MSHSDALVSVVIPGAPRTKKNHSRIVWNGNRPRILPSKAHEEWAEQAERRCTIKGRKAIAEPVNCRASIYREALTGDAVGFYQAIADLLEKVGVVENDKWIVSWDGTRLMKDAKEPRIELCLEAAS